MNATASAIKPAEFWSIKNVIQQQIQDTEDTISGALGRLNQMDPKIDSIRSRLEQSRGMLFTTLNDDLQALEQEKIGLQAQLKEGRRQRLEFGPKRAELLGRCQRMQDLRDSGVVEWPAQRRQMVDDQTAAGKSAAKLEKELAVLVTDLEGIQTDNAIRLDRLATGISAHETIEAGHVQEMARLRSDDDDAFILAVAEGRATELQASASDPRVTAIGHDILRVNSRLAALRRGLEEAARIALQAQQVAGEKVAAKRAQLEESRKRQSRLGWDIAVGDLVLIAADLYESSDFPTRFFSLQVFDNARVPGGQFMEETRGITDTTLSTLARVMGCTDSLDSILADARAAGVEIPAS